MNLDTPVMEVTIYKGNAEVIEVIRKDLCPWGTQGGSNIKRWLQSRRIPASREHIDTLLDSSGLTLDELVQKSLGLSLSDSYWLKPLYSGITWAQVNFFENDFTDDVGEFLMSGGVADELGDMYAPSNTTDGVMLKKWIIRNGTRYLVKREEGLRYRHMNEVLAARIAKALELPHVPYFKLDNDTCMCPCMIKPGQHLVTAFQYMQQTGVINKPRAEQYPALCEAFGKSWLDGMLIFDYIVMNSDRHTKNFGFIQDAATMMVIEPFPIFDNGNSLFYDVNFGEDEPFNNLPCRSKPFVSSHDKQIQLVDLKPFQERLHSLEGIIHNLVSSTFEGSRLRKEFIYSMGNLLQHRTRLLC